LRSIGFAAQSKNTAEASEILVEQAFSLFGRSTQNSNQRRADPT
jgi:hypothetical protein